MESIARDEVVFIRATRPEQHWPGRPALATDYAGAVLQRQLTNQAIEELRDALIDLQDELLALQWHNEWSPAHASRAVTITTQMAALAQAIVAEATYERRPQ